MTRDDTARVGTPLLNYRVGSSTPRTADRSSTLAAWIALVGIVCPSVPISLGDLIFTPGRLVVYSLLTPALVKLFHKGRNTVTSDYFAIMAGGWIIISSILNGGFRPYVVAEALEYVSAYAVGRAFFCDPLSLQTFARVLKLVTIVVILLGLLDSLAGRHVTWQLVGLRDVDPASLPNHYRFGIMRAASTFPGYELFGTYCVAAAAIFLYSERGLSRIVYVSFATFGCILSLSSGPLLAIFIVMASFAYDRVLKKYSSRWKALVFFLITFMGAIFVFVENPVGWFVRNLTIDPSTGYFRVAEWAGTFIVIQDSPWIGRGFAPFANISWAVATFVADQGIDCVWLVEAIRYGCPVVVFLLLAIFASIWSMNRTFTGNRYISNMRTGFSFAIVIMSIVGLTVHFWDSVWIFLSLCIGIRASFNERYLASTPRAKNVTAEQNRVRLAV